MSSWIYCRETVQGSAVQGSEVQGSEVQGSAQPLAKKTACQIAKETLALLGLKQA